MKRTWYRMWIFIQKKKKRFCKFKRKINGHVIIQKQKLRYTYELWWIAKIS